MARGRLSTLFDSTSSERYPLVTIFHTQELVQEGLGKHKKLEKEAIKEKSSGKDPKSQQKYLHRY
eukprot:scaffold16162_cov71-Cyclotella_meneghiniana.AAC.5